MSSIVMNEKMAKISEQESCVVGGQLGGVRASQCKLAGDGGLHWQRQHSQQLPLLLAHLPPPLTLWSKCSVENYFADKNGVYDASNEEHKLFQHDEANGFICMLNSSAGPILTCHQSSITVISLPPTEQEEEEEENFISVFQLYPSIVDEGLLIRRTQLASLTPDNTYANITYETEPKPDQATKNEPILNHDTDAAAGDQRPPLSSTRNKESLLVNKQHRTQSTFSLLLLLLLVTVINNQNALPCLGLDYTQRPDHPGFTGYNFPQTSSLTMPHNLNYRHYFIANQNPTYADALLRHLNGDPLEIMPTSPLDSFAKDDLVPGSPGPTLSSSWSSMFAGAFNNNNGNKDTLDAHIKRILVPRVSGTQGNIQVREYIVNSLKANNYHIELDEFTGSTPVGNVQFANIIASSNPNACRQLVLACHYDSKKMDGFLGAIDSAVPCAMLLKLSETFKTSFRPSSSSSGQDGGGNSEQRAGADGSLGLRFIFFDGEEAFVEWSDEDSLYGARHLAQKWEQQPAPSQCSGGKKNELGRIELFVLLDLIGTTDTSFVMYNRQLRHHYNAMQSYEKSHLTKSGLTSQQIRKESAFRGRFVPLDFVQDDHVPFKQRGVPILSLLAHPFPKVWHTIQDDYSAIDFNRTRRILYVLEEFVANYSKGE